MANYPGSALGKAGQQILEDDEFAAQFSGSSACPSLSSSFLSVDTSPVDLVMRRSQSVASSIASIGRDIFSASSRSLASPVTPLSTDFSDHRANTDPSLCMTGELGIFSMYEPSKDHAEDPNCLWMCTDTSECEDSETFLSRYGSTGVNVPNIGGLIISNGWQMLADPNTTPTVQTSFSGTAFPGEWQMLTDPSSNPSFSRGIFDEHQESSANCLNDNAVDWMPTVLQTPPQTVAPSAMFQTTLAPSPVHLIDPSTPQQFVRPASSILSSSPCPLYSPGQFSSQHSYNNSEDISEEVRGTPRHAFKVKRHASRVNRSCQHPRHVGSANRLKSGTTKSGMNCDVVIEGNKYACEFQDCVDKNGKQRMFKRREHAKRHVETVHKKRNQFKCWVPECTAPPFTRNDNLKMHKKTHLKRSGNTRNRYVATLDPSNQFYDPEYEGPLDEDGNPTQ